MGTDTFTSGVIRQYPASDELKMRFNAALISGMKEKGFSLGAAPQDDFLYFTKIWSGPFGFGLMLSVFLTEENGIITITVKGYGGCAIDNLIRTDINMDISNEGPDGEIKTMSVIDYVFSITDGIYKKNKPMIRGTTFFKCPQCGLLFSAPDIEYHCSALSVPMPCPKCGARSYTPGPLGDILKKYDNQKEDSETK